MQPLIWSDSPQSEGERFFLTPPDRFFFRQPFCTLHTCSRFRLQGDPFRFWVSQHVAYSPRLIRSKQECGASKGLNPSPPQLIFLRFIRPCALLHFAPKSPACRYILPPTPALFAAVSPARRHRRQRPLAPPPTLLLCVSRPRSNRRPTTRLP